jgi:hypothetical protein
MAQTTKITITNDAWTAMPKDGPFVCVQPQAPMSMIVRIDDVAPDDEDVTGLIIAGANGENAPRSFSAGNVPDGAILYARTKDQADAELTVITY